MTRKRIFKWLRIILTVYLLGGVALYFLQDLILFHPVSLKRHQAFDFSIPHKDLNIPLTGTDTLNLVDFASTGPVKRGMVLYFHGNKKNINWYAKYIPYFTRHGYEVLMIDYPGYGKSTGKLTEQKLYDWSLLAYNLARQRFTADSIIIFGKSMGTGIAAHLASIRDCRALLLETPYYDFPSVVSHYLPIYPVRKLLHYQLPTYQFLPLVKSPITIFQGTDDRLVTYSNAKRLIPLLKPGDRFLRVEGGSHNNLFTYPEMVQTLDSVLLH